MPRDNYNNPLPSMKTVRDPITGSIEDVPADAPHSRLQFDAKIPNRVYSATEFDANGMAVRRLDFAGRRVDPLPHWHDYDPITQEFVDPKIPYYNDFVTPNPGINLPAWLIPVMQGQQNQ